MQHLRPDTTTYLACIKNRLTHSWPCLAKMLQNRQRPTYNMKSKHRVLQTKAKVFNKVFCFVDLPPQLRNKTYDYLSDENASGGRRDESRIYTARIPRVALSCLYRQFRSDYDARISLGAHHRLCDTDSLFHDPKTFALASTVPPVARFATRLDLDLLAALSEDVYNRKKKRTDEVKETMKETARPKRISYNTSLPRGYGSRDEVCREMWYHTHYVCSCPNSWRRRRCASRSMSLPSSVCYTLRAAATISMALQGRNGGDMVYRSQGEIES